MSAGRPLEVGLAGEADRRHWEEFAGAVEGAEAGHRWEFHELLARLFRVRVFRLVALRGGRWTAVLPLVFQGSVLGRFLTSVPYLNHAGVLGSDPEARRALAERAMELAEEVRAHRLELRGRDGSDLPVAVWEGKAGYSLDLPGTVEPLWEGLGAKLRAQIRRPGKEGFTARVASDEGRRHFHRLLAKRWHDLGTPILPEEFFLGLAEAFPGALDYVLVERGGRVSASGVLLFHGDTAEIPWASSASEDDRFGVNMLLYWQSLHRAVERGAARFDFGRSTPGTGNARFKLQWGASETALRWNVLARGRAGRSSERGDARRGLAATVWRRLPGPLAARLGPLLAARIPL